LDAAAMLLRYFQPVREAFRIPPLDIALSTGFLVIAVGETVANDAIAPKGAALVTESVLALTLLIRRRAPLAAVVIASIVATVEAIAGVPLNAPMIPLLVYLVLAYSLVSYAPVLRALVGTAVILVSLAIQTIVQGKGVDNFLFGLFFLVAMWFMGWTVRRRTADAVAAELATARLLEDVVLERQRAAAVERVRIARELHDVIAHSVSLMVVQAGAAEQMLLHSPDRALEPIRAVADTGREALEEMGRLLGVLRQHGEEVGLAPQPGVRDLPRLVEQSRALGVDVDLAITGTPRALPPGVELTIYRIVQEALTNTRKHATALVASVRLHYGRDEVDIEIADPGPTSSPRTRHAALSGHGLVGMHERVAVYGGGLEAGPNAGGGFTVTARIPVDPAP
jgi:signal transduction histidine kinase